MVSPATISSAAVTSWSILAAASATTYGDTSSFVPRFTSTTSTTTPTSSATTTCFAPGRQSGTQSVRTRRSDAAVGLVSYGGQFRRLGWTLHAVAVRGAPAGLPPKSERALPKSPNEPTRGLYWENLRSSPPSAFRFSPPSLPPNNLMCP